LPLWATEFGYATAPTRLGKHVTPEQRAIYLRQALDFFPDTFPSLEVLGLWNLAQRLPDGDEKAAYNLASDQTTLDAIASYTCPGEPSRLCPYAPAQPPIVALAPDVRIHLGDSEYPSPWWPLYGGRVPSLEWQGGFYLREIPTERQTLLLEILQPNQFGNEIRLNGSRLHPAALPVADFTAQWLTLRLPIAPAQLRPGWNELSIRAGHLPPDFHKEGYIWDDVQLRNVRLVPSRSP
ncbi:MAG: hypothetical protein ACRDIB_07195, partial [Ardenticatenaceae bacterium]